MKRALVFLVTCRLDVVYVRHEFLLALLDGLMPLTHELLLVLLDGDVVRHWIPRHTDLGRPLSACFSAVVSFILFIQSTEFGSVVSCEICDTLPQGGFSLAFGGLLVCMAFPHLYLSQQLKLQRSHLLLSGHFRMQSFQCLDSDD